MITLYLEGESEHVFQKTNFNSLQMGVDKKFISK